MNPQFLSVLADIVLATHLGIVVFNIFGLVAVPLGAWFRWRFVRIFWWRALHLASLAVVALQAVLGRACFLTIWQVDLLQSSGANAAQEPMIRHWLESVLYWNLPDWVFLAAYVGIWVYAILLWILVRPKPGGIATRA